MQQRLALVVVDDPHDRVVARRDRWLLADRFRIADAPTAELRVTGTPDRLTLVRRNGKLTTMDARCTINGEVPKGAMEVRAGDTVVVADVVVRVVEADLLDRVKKVGDWLVLENLWTTRDGGPVFGPLSSAERGFAWLLVAGIGNDDVAAFARAAGSRAALAAVKDTFVRGTTAENGELDTVFDIGAAVPLAELRLRALSSASSSAPLSLALRIGLDLNAALTALWDATRRLSHLDALVTFDGKIALRPTVRPWTELDERPAGRQEEAARYLRAWRGFEDDTDDGFSSFADVDAAMVAEVVCGLAPSHVELQTLLELQQDGPLSPLVVDAMLRRLSRDAGVADDDEVKGYVRGLFPDEHRRALALQEELELLDDDAVARLVRR